MKKKKERTLSDALVHRVGDLDIDQDLPMQKRLWIFQRIGRTFWAIALLLALAGLFGTGPISQKVAKDSQETLSVEYEKFAHVYNSDILKLTFGKGAAVGGKVHFWVDNDFLKENSIQRFTPEPVSSRLENDRTVYEFNANPNVESSNIVMEIKAEKAGFQNVAMGLLGGREVTVTKFFWP